MLNTPSYKLILILGLSLVLLIPIFMIESKTSDRANRRAEAHASVSQHWTTTQWISSPILSIPLQTIETDQHGVRRSQQRWALLPAQSVVVDAQLEAQTRKKGIYEVPIYNTTIKMQGSFSKNKLLNMMQELALDPSSSHIGTPSLALSVADMRGLDSHAITINGTAVSFESGSHIKGLPKGYTPHCQRRQAKKI